MKLLSIFLVTAAVAAAQTRALHPAITAALDEVSEERIAATMKKLESFGTRDIHSATNAAAQHWLAAEFKSAHPRLEVSLDPHQIPKKGRVQRDLTVTNVVAKLPGKVHPDVHVLLIAHYDSIALIQKANVTDWAATSANSRAPGVSDSVPWLGAPTASTDSTSLSGSLSLASRPVAAGTVSTALLATA